MRIRFFPKSCYPMTLESNLLLLFPDRDAWRERKGSFYLAYTSCFQQSSRHFTQRWALHLEWDLIHQLFKTVWADLHHWIKSRKLNLLIPPISHPIPLTSAGISQTEDRSQLYCWRHKQPRLSRQKSNAEPSQERHGIITQVFTL